MIVKGVEYTYEEDVEPMVCNCDFHFCEKAVDCFNYYKFNSKNKVAKVLVLDKNILIIN